MNDYGYDLIPEEFPVYRKIQKNHTEAP